MVLWCYIVFYDCLNKHKLPHDKIVMNNEFFVTPSEAHTHSRVTLKSTPCGRLISKGYLRKNIPLVYVFIIIIISSFPYVFQLKLADINKINIGLKDMSKTLFEVWKEVFQVQPVPLAEAAREGEEGPAGALRGRARRLMRTVYSAGDYER